MALTIPWLVREQRVTVAHACGAAFLLWAAVTLIWASNRYDGINAIFILLVLAACFCLGNQVINLHKVWSGAGIGLAISAFIIAADWTHLLSFMPGPSLSGLFVNRNFFAEAAALILIAAVSERNEIVTLRTPNFAWLPRWIPGPPTWKVGFRPWWLIPLLLPSMLMTESRGAIASVAVALAVLYRRHWPIVVAVAAIGLLFIGLDSFKVDNSASERLVIWHSAVNGLTFFGHGIGSFWTSYPQFDLRTIVNDTPEQAHNELLTIAFELGLPGICLTLGFATALAGPLNTSRLVLIGIAVESITQFPLHLPTTAFLGMVAAGHAVRDAPLLRTVLDRSRISYRPSREGASI